MLDRYINLLKSGQIVAFPTETVYGLGGDAWNLGAIEKIFEAKGRPTDNPLIVHIASEKMLQQFAAAIPDDAQKLIDAFWPGPLSLIFNKQPDVLDIVTAGLPTVAVRWPGHPLTVDIIREVGPLVAPSANTSGRPSPTKPEHIQQDLGEHFPIIDAGETQIGLESTVLDVSTTPFTLHRPGAISQNQIENILEKPIQLASNNLPDAPAKSPGTKYSHYSPDARVAWMPTHSPINQPKALYLIHQSVAGAKSTQNIIFYHGDYEEMAHQLYDRFRQADREGYATVWVQPLSEELQKHEPMALALQNRIEKAIGR